MKKVKFIIDWRNKKKGEMVNYSDKSAEHMVSQGFAKYVKEESLFQEIEVSPEQQKKDIYDSKIRVRNNEINKAKIITPEGHVPLPNGSLKEQVWQALLEKDRDKATELIVKGILDKHYIYCTRDDEKSEMWIYEEGIYVPQGKTRIKEFCRDNLMKVYTEQFANRVISKIETDTFIDTNTFFNKINVFEVPVLNGILNIITKELRPFNPEEIFFNKLPIEYETDKTCQNIIKHFETVLKHKTDLVVIQELFGFLLLKEYKIEKAFMFVGNGRNGKGKSIELMKLFIGLDNCAGVPLQDLDNDNYSKAELLNKMANLAGDISAKSLKSDAWFKALTGRDLIGAARKFKTRINFVNYAKMIFSANELPKTYDTTRAFWDRWILLEFPYTFVKQEELDEVKDDKEFYKLIDPDIIKKISTKGEMSGLLNWALIGLERLLKNNGFSNSESVVDIQNFWQRKSDSFLAFCKDYITEDYDGQISKKKIRKSYVKYCRTHKLKAQSQRSIRETLIDEYGAAEARTMLDDTQTYVWEGIKWNEKAIEIYIDDS